MRHPIVTLIIFILLAVNVNAQRRINPVETPATQTTAINLNPKDSTAVPDPSKMPNLVTSKDSKGNIIYIDTISGKEIADSSKIDISNIIEYPLWDEVTIGVNIWDPIMRVFGQEYGLFDVWAELSLYNRIKPIIEFGLGNASYTPEDGNYTYKSATAPYFKIGANYNILYKKKKVYQFYFGARYGFSSFSYELTNITIDNPYWNEYFSTSIPPQDATVSFGELVMGLKVKIFNQLSLGWTFKYHTIISESDYKYGRAWYIPGYGTRNSSFTGGFNVMYTIPLSKKKVKVQATSNETPNTSLPKDNK